MAEAITRHLLARRANGRIDVDSAGTHARSGQPPHPEVLRLLDRHGIRRAGLRSRRVTAADLLAFDRVIAMDQENQRDLEALGPSRRGVELLLPLDPDARWVDVPDPYIVGGFPDVFAMLEQACAALVEQLCGGSPDLPD